MATQRSSFAKRERDRAKKAKRTGDTFEQWRLSNKTPDVPSPLIHDGLVYLCGEGGELTSEGFAARASGMSGPEGARAARMGHVLCRWTWQSGYGIQRDAT